MWTLRTHSLATVAGSISSISSPSAVLVPLEMSSKQVGHRVLSVDGAFPFHVPPEVWGLGFGV